MGSGITQQLQRHRLQRHPQRHHAAGEPAAAGARGSTDGDPVACHDAQPAQQPGLGPAVGGDGPHGAGGLSAVQASSSDSAAVGVALAAVPSPAATTSSSTARPRAGDRLDDQRARRRHDDRRRRRHPDNRRPGDRGERPGDARPARRDDQRGRRAGAGLGRAVGAGQLPPRPDGQEHGRCPRLRGHQWPVGRTGVAFGGNAVEAVDADLLVNNIPIVSASNTLDTVVPGRR